MKKKSKPPKPDKAALKAKKEAEKQAEAEKARQEAQEAAQKAHEASEASKKAAEAQEAARKAREAQEEAQKAREAQEAARKAKEDAQRAAEAQEAARKAKEAQEATKKAKETKIDASAPTPIGHLLLVYFSEAEKPLGPRLLVNLKTKVAHWSDPESDSLAATGGIKTEDVFSGQHPAKWAEASGYRAVPRPATKEQLKP